MKRELSRVCPQKVKKMEKGLEEHNPMEAVVQDLLIYLRHQQTEVRKKALEALFAYSGDPTVQRAIQHQDFVKAIKACLYDVVTALLT